MTYPPSQGPYGQPHQPPHGQGGYPYQYPQQPGQYPAGPPPRKNKTGLILGLVALGVVVVVGVVLAIVLTSGDDKAAAPPPSSSAAAPPPSSSPSTSAPSSSSSSPSGGGIPAADASKIGMLANFIQANLNRKNLDGLLINVCSPAENKEKARKDVLEQLPMMDPAGPDHQRVWFFGAGTPSKASGDGYAIEFKGSFTDTPNAAISLTFKAYVDNGRASWCGMRKGA